MIDSIFPNEYPQNNQENPATGSQDDASEPQTVDPDQCNQTSINAVVDLPRK